MVANRSEISSYLNSRLTLLMNSSHRVSSAICLSKNHCVKYLKISKDAYESAKPFVIMALFYLLLILLRVAHFSYSMMCVITRYLVEALKDKKLFFISADSYYFTVCSKYFNCASEYIKKKPMLYHALNVLRSLSVKVFLTLRSYYIKTQPYVTEKLNTLGAVLNNNFKELNLYVKDVLDRAEQCAISSHSLTADKLGFEFIDIEVAGDKKSGDSKETNELDASLADSPSIIKEEAQNLPTLDAMLKTETSSNKTEAPKFDSTDVVDETSIIKEKAQNLPTLDAMLKSEPSSNKTEAPKFDSTDVVDENCTRKEILLDKTSKEKASFNQSSIGPITVKEVTLVRRVKPKTEKALRKKKEKEMRKAAIRQEKILKCLEAKRIESK